MNGSAASMTPQVDKAALAKASGAAVAVAALVLTLFVLPAEYGIDPTGAGGALGITGMATAAEADAPVTTSTGADAAVRIAVPDKTAIARKGVWREDEMTIDLAPHSGREIKAHMGAGDSFVFEWAARGGPVKLDMHGERPDAAEGEFTSYWKERELTEGKGVFTAPFAGKHGWYWRNKGDTPVSVTVRVAGFHKDLFEPEGS